MNGAGAGGAARAPDGGRGATAENGERLQCLPRSWSAEQGPATTAAAACRAGSRCRLETFYSATAATRCPLQVVAAPCPGKPTVS
jgi:hypothetical protein